MLRTASRPIVLKLATLDISVINAANSVSASKVFNGMFVKLHSKMAYPNSTTPSDTGEGIAASMVCGASSITAKHAHTV